MAKNNLLLLLQVCWAQYLEKLKQHMVEMGWHIDNVEGLVRVFGCETSDNILITWREEKRHF